MPLAMFALVLTVVTFTVAWNAGKVRQPEKRAALLGIAMVLLLLWLIALRPWGAPTQPGTAALDGIFYGLFNGVVLEAPGPAWFIQKFRNRKATKTTSKGDAA